MKNSTSKVQRSSTWQVCGSHLSIDGDRPGGPAPWAHIQSKHRAISDPTSLIFRPPSHPRQRAKICSEPSDLPLPSPVVFFGISHLPHSTFHPLYHRQPNSSFDRKIPWRLSRPQKARQRKRLRAVDAVVATIDAALAKQNKTAKVLERWKAEMPREEQMKPKDKYTFFDRKEKGYRKGVHSESTCSCVSSFFSVQMPFSLICCRSFNSREGTSVSGSIE